MSGRKVLWGSFSVLTTDEVSRREGIPLRKVQRMCADGSVFPCKKSGRGWIIGEAYVFIPPEGYPIDLPHEIYTKRKRGRPPGTPNKKPYPTRKKSTIVS